MVQHILFHLVNALGGRRLCFWLHKTHAFLVAHSMINDKILSERTTVQTWK